ncbi:hypothetical protein SERLA73DRAFT_68443 [Serpula lacrymans var. lacrymans S7.3]|uniref:Uncharacterized protein n=1 Tax=Serpula lacrymans var. lacrymans (strain S7.3) TaxID=936435 RepID=F8PFW3_SERL3|nr:hypothetical protein SERLA73DRAFT_68443 [Serpula lacrymans var. lacrymans S7.3]
MPISNLYTMAPKLFRQEPCPPAEPPPLPAPTSRSHSQFSPQPGSPLPVDGDQHSDPEHPEVEVPQRGSPLPMDVDESSDGLEAEFTDASEHFYRTYHLYLNGQPCTADGVILPPDSPPFPAPEKSPDDWTPYRNRIEFELAELLFK